VKYELDFWEGRGTAVKAAGGGEGGKQTTRRARSCGHLHLPYLGWDLVITDKFVNISLFKIIRIQKLLYYLVC
jgi:hypothetical protein